jgi:hypothetical protein
MIAPIAFAPVKQYVSPIKMCAGILRGGRSGELRKHCPVEGLIRGELAGLLVDERELDDGG